eukprot:CAMPEP_0197176230 /NCGR_PEP_ID=MMETSP1423-20130617/2229_1 /TAXON_ID=476441 /ORGANISM="Pseudo-nitzschia heimii, Strain UNC1101" /LENGTH=144 /DNA_ID=CAMNT_0042625573 /DNA_START=149 /DNA_END=582 /DNA_ORIENTATION=-
MASQQHKKTLAPDNISNLHRGLELALESLKVEMEKENTITWKHLPWNGRTYKVKMKFAVAFVIGDTELHDKLCCRYGGRNSDVKENTELGKQRAELLKQQERSLALLAKQVNPQRLKDIIDSSVSSMTTSSTASTVSVVAPWEV